jgi:hypothetical protein
MWEPFGKVAGTPESYKISQMRLGLLHSLGEGRLSTETKNLIEDDGDARVTLRSKVCRV